MRLLTARAGRATVGAMSARLLFAWWVVSSLLVPAQEATDGSASPAGPAAALALETAIRDRLGHRLEALDLDVIMLGDDFFGTRPSFVRWTPDGRAVLFSWKRWDEREVGTYRYDVETRLLRRLPAGAEAPPARRSGPRGRREAWTRGPDVFVADAGKPGRRVARLAAGVSDLTFAADGRALLFRTSRGVFRLSTEGGELVQLLTVDATAKKKPGNRPKDGKDLPSWHRDRQQELFRVLFEQKQREDRAKERRKAAEERRDAVPSWGPEKGFSVRSAAISPRGDFVAFSVGKRATPRRAVMPDYVTRDGYTRTRDVRAKVGDAVGERALVVVDLASGSGVRVTCPEIDGKASLGGLRWSADGRFLVATARTDDDEHAYLLKVGPASGVAEVVDRVSDPAWVNWSVLRPRFLGSGSRVFYLSEESGYAHLHVSDLESGETRALTEGRFEVSGPVATRDGSRIYALATPTSPHVRDLVEVDPVTGEMTVLTADGGGRTFSLSPDGRFVAEVFSSANRPWELAVRRLDAGAKPDVVTDSPSPAFKSRKWEAPEIVHVPASDGAKIPARIYRPERPRSGRPAVLFVHGAGYLQNVHNWWSSYQREYAFHHFLRDAGYLVLDLDYRGSAGYGRDWRCAIRAHMGGRDLDDYVDAARWLVSECGTAREKIGIYGGSYGGFITLMALFTKPGVFRAGAALRPVTDWAHYNDGYTSNILDDPQENPGAYRRSSPINFAEGLRDHLLICHGMLDSNVHVQDVFRLQQRLIELRKKNWEVALYPLEGHGFRDPASWTDEYRRIKSLFDRVLR